MKTYEDIINYVIRNFGHECGFTIEILYYIQWKFPADLVWKMVEDYEDTIYNYDNFGFEV